MASQTRPLIVGYVPLHEGEAPLLARGAARNRRLHLAWRGGVNPELVVIADGSSGWAMRILSRLRKDQVRLVA